MEKSKILNNIESLPVDKLVEFIQQGIVTMEELMNTGQLSALKRSRIKDLINIIDQEDTKYWYFAADGSIEDLNEYIDKFPNGKFVKDAIYKIQELKNKKIKLESYQNEIINDLNNDFNKFSLDNINDFLSRGIITKNNLLGCNIPAHVVYSLNNIKPPVLSLGDIPKTIPEGYTEVFFWGIPGSGKTCALAAILSTANKEGYLDISLGPGYEYMTKLQNLFINKTAYLPPPSPVDTSQYLPFTLKKRDERFARSISLFELSGEIFNCFYYKNAQKEFPSPLHENTFSALERFLMGRNRKIHFFFIDYVKENREDRDGLTQANYLSAASTFFKNNLVFDKTTDAIYVIITKSDLMPCNTHAERISYSKQYLEANFSSFINTLKDRARQYGINDGRLTVEPFSLGNIYFNVICDFDDSPAKRVLNILLERIRPSQKNILDFFNK